MNKKGILLLLSIVLFLPLAADEGMWIPLLLEKFNIEDMNKEGLNLTAEDIYSINKSSLKDAVVIFGGGCTGEVVSDRGLLFTNHHCGYGYIQSHSSVENDYLTNGYWAMNRDEELPAPGLSVRFLVRIEDVTENAMEGISNDISEQERMKIVRKNIERIEAEALEGTHYKAVTKPFYYGSEYYMFIYEKFDDIRLVGTPPEAVGNFGKDLDNWMWPRHTGDFSVFRIYADKNNHPAGYSPDNLPYKPKSHLPVSLKGVDENDFTFLMGYPGSTQQYYISDGVAILKNKSFPHKIDLRDKRLEIMDKYMKADDEVRIQYASKFRSVSNSWKKWKGIILGMNRVGALDSIRSEEQAFTQWVHEDPERKKKYGSVIPEIKQLYDQLDKYTLVYDYLEEAVLACELIDFTSEVLRFINNNRDFSFEEKTVALNRYMNSVSSFYKDYYAPLDKEVTIEMMHAFRDHIDPGFHPEVFDLIDQKYNGDMEKYVNKLFKKTVFASEEKLRKALSDYPEKEDKVRKKFSKDMTYELFYSFISVYSEKVFGSYSSLNTGLDQLYRTYVQGIREMYDNAVYPDANFTMRVTYGETKGYSPRDGIYYDYYTTLSGKIDKFRLGYEDYYLPEELVTLYINRDYGPYADEDGSLRVCFIATNHTSGGNSGSPVLNANGELVGLNFDRSWEGTMSDLYYDAGICRNISVDIRYVLFIIDKLAGSGYLLNEMDIIK